MVNIDQIPAEVRWRLATQAVNDLPFVYGMVYRNIVGEMYTRELDEASRRIWMEAGKEQAAVARAFALPVRNAMQVAQAFATVCVLYMGPEMNNGEVRPGEGDSAVLTLERCPMYTRSLKWGMDPKKIITDCRAYCMAGVQALNPDYEVKFEKSLCAGDAGCKMRVEKKG
ncbi:MAG: hypothetical protein LUQ64_03190 [Methanomicrobiales archaeon]|nr:hypothetical protein [Methanomicrobiales archaeon]